MSNTATYRESFETLVKKYRRLLYFYALQMLRNREDAEEAVQDAFVRAYRAWNRHNGNPAHYGRLRAWLFKITLNVVRNRLRRKRVPQVSFDPMNDSRLSHNVLEHRLSPDLILDRHATVALVECAICELPSHLVAAARLRFIEGLSHSEIAQQCSQPEGTVKSHVFRARQKLRQALQSVLAL